MIPPLSPGPSAGGPGGFGLGAAARGRIAPPEPSIWSGSALVLTRMKWVGREDTYRTSWSRNEGDGDAIDLPGLVAFELARSGFRFVRGTMEVCCLLPPFLCLFMGLWLGCLSMDAADELY
jgi:hypothetical protein